MNSSKAPQILKIRNSNESTLTMTLTFLLGFQFIHINLGFADDLGVRFENGICSVNAFDSLYNKTCSTSDTNSLLCSIAKGQFNPNEGRPTYQLIGPDILNSTPWMECSKIGPGDSLPTEGQGMNIQGSLFSGADFSGKDLSGISFQFTKTINSKFEKAKFDGNEFSECQIQRANFKDAVFENVVLTSASIKDSNFEGAQLKNINNSRNDGEGNRAIAVEKVNFSKAYFENVEFKEWKSKSSLDLTETVMKDSSFESVKAFSIDLKVAEIEEEIDATSAKWTNVTMNIEKGTLNLAGATLDKVTVLTRSDVDLSNSTLKQMTFVGIPKSVKLSGANIEKLDFVRSEMVDKKVTFFPIYFANIECTKIGQRTVYDFSIAPIIATKTIEHGVESPIANRAIDFNGAVARKKFIESRIGVIDNTGNIEDCKKAGSDKLQKALEAQGLKVTD